jgi:hypothetical protein
VDGKASYQVILIRPTNARQLEGKAAFTWQEGEKFYAAHNFGNYLYACVGDGFVRVQWTTT